MGDFWTAMLSGAFGGGLVSLLVAKVIADRGEVGRRRAGDRLELIGVLAHFRVTVVQAGAGMIQLKRPLDASTYSNQSLVNFAADCVRLAQNLGPFQRHGVHRMVRDLVGSLHLREASDFAQIPSSDRGGRTMLWASHVITQMNASPAGRVALAHQGLLEQAFTTHELAKFEEAERRLGRLLWRLRVGL